MLAKAWAKLRSDRLAARGCLVVGVWLVLFAIAFIVDRNGQSIFLGTGAWFQLAAFFSTLLLYGLLKHGAFMHAVPYALSLIGTALLFASEAKQPLIASAFFLAMTAVMHVIVVCDMRNNRTQKSKATG